MNICHVTLKIAAGAPVNSTFRTDCSFCWKDHLGFQWIFGYSTLILLFLGWRRKCCNNFFICSRVVKSHIVPLELIRFEKREPTVHTSHLLEPVSHIRMSVFYMALPTVRLIEVFSTDKTDVVARVEKERSGLRLFWRVCLGRSVLVRGRLRAKAREDLRLFSML